MSKQNFLLLNYLLLEYCNIHALVQLVIIVVPTSPRLERLLTKVRLTNNLTRLADHLARLSGLARLGDHLARLSDHLARLSDSLVGLSDHLLTGDGGLFGSNRLADTTAFFGAVGFHPLGVLGTFSVLGPFFTFGRTFLSSRYGIVVLASLFDSRTFVGIFFADVTTGLHAVGSHPFGVGITLTFRSSGSPGVTRRMCVLDTEIGSVFARAFVEFQSIFTSANRTARLLAVLKHPVGICGTLRRLLLGPSRAVTVFVDTFCFFSRTVFSVFFFGCFGGSCGFSFGNSLIAFSHSSALNTGCNLSYGRGIFFGSFAFSVGFGISTHGDSDQSSKNNEFHHLNKISLK